MSDSITVPALETNKQDLFVGRNKKIFDPTDLLRVYPEKPKDTFGKWKTTHVQETSGVFLDWLNVCQEIVDEEFGLYEWDLKVKKYNKFIWVVMENTKKKQRPFAFIDKSTANIHCPATFDDPFDHYCGNICDIGTRFAVIGPYGVKTVWAFLPTHPDNKPVK